MIKDRVYNLLTLIQLRETLMILLKVYRRRVYKKNEPIDVAKSVKIQYLNKHISDIAFFKTISIIIDLFVSFSKQGEVNEV